MFGLVADYVSSRGLKKRVAWLGRDTSRPRQSKFGKVLLTSFLSGFLFRILDKSFSARFVLRSLLVSIIMLSTVVSLQAIFHDDVIDKVASIGETGLQFAVILSLLLFVNLGIDLVSNLTTLVLLRLAATSGDC